MNLQSFFLTFLWLMVKDFKKSQALIARTSISQNKLLDRLRPKLSSKRRPRRQIVQVFDHIPSESRSEVPSSTYDQDLTSTPSNIEISVERIAKLAIPAVGIWLCSPLLSVIDTSAVGLLSGTLQQAALNPAVAVTDYSARCMVRRHVKELLIFIQFHGWSSC
jgi:hypothetical protein